METFISWWVWLIVLLFSLIIGTFLVFFPHKLVRLRAKIVKGTFRNLSISDEQIDKSSFYTSLYGENYSKRLDAQIADPKHFRSLIFLTRLMGIFVLFFTLMDICLIILAVQTESL